MPNLTSVTLTAGVPTAGTGTVSTLDNMLGTAGAGASTNVLTVQGSATGTAVPATVTNATAANLLAQVSQPTAASLNATVVQSTASNLKTQATLVDSGGTDATDTTNHAIKVNVVAGGAGGGIVTQATAANLNAQAQITDGTNGVAAIKPANTAAATTDKALVVTLSPNGLNPNGATTSANSAPVVIASDQATFPVTATLAAGSAIAGKFTTDQTTHGTTDLVAADITKYGGSATSLGQKTMANSVPVTIASDQNAYTINSNLTSISSSALNLGSTTSSASLPVVIASDQGTVAVAQDALHLMNGVTGTTLTPTHVAITASASGATQVVAAQGVGNKIRVIQWIVTTSGTVNFKFQSAANDLTGLFYAASAGGGAGGSYMPVGHFTTNANEALNINLSGATAVGGYLKYVVVQ